MPSFAGVACSADVYLSVNGIALINSIRNKRPSTRTRLQIDAASADQPLYFFPPFFFLDPPFFFLLPCLAAPGALPDRDPA